MRTPLLSVGAVLALSITGVAGSALAELEPGQKMHGFTVANVYENGLGAAMGARFISDEYGFIVDLLQIESVPQAFYWIKTPASSSMGEPHACEHLLLGKGNRGRYVAVLEDMSLGSSSAFTAQIKTCYHFNTIAGEETFYRLFEAQLQALLHPDFTDEEIRREVSHFGVVNNEDGSLTLEEKGTVYTEMVSSFEKPWYHYGHPMDVMVYGENHPLSYISGGEPAEMRKMIPRDLWSFHRRTHHLANMGAIVSVPAGMNPDNLLARMEEILARCQPPGSSGDTPDSISISGMSTYSFPALNMAPHGKLLITSYPSEKKADPGYVSFAWPADLELEPNDKFVLELFLGAFVSGETSNLYDLFINSQTRKVDFGGNYVYGGVNSEQGNSIYIGMVGIDNRYVTETMVDSVRSMVLAEINRVRNFADGSPELAEFNKRVNARLKERQREIEYYLNSPPMFGYRSGVGAGWVTLLEDLEKEPGFRKSLVMKNRFAYTESLLATDRNFWRNHIDRWRLGEIKPYAVGAGPNPEMLASESKAKQTRIEEFTRALMERYDVDDPQSALARYREEFDGESAKLEAIASHDKLPQFIDDPPLTLDDKLNYQVMSLPSSNIPLIASTFENMTSAKIGIALGLDVVPESLLVYVPFLPSLMTSIGVIKDGEVVRYETMVERLRSEILSLDAYFDASPFTDRVEIVLAGSGNNLNELKRALSWMDAALYSPYLSVDNLARMKDILDQSLISFRNRTKGSEEGWVDEPADAYRYQESPLRMTTGCFLTQAHYFQRLKWMLTDPGSGADQAQLAELIDALAKVAEKNDRNRLSALLNSVENYQVADTAGGSELLSKLHNCSDLARQNFKEVAKTLKASLADIPDDHLQADWAYLCAETKTDISVGPESAIKAFQTVLSLIRKADNVRLFIISNSSDRHAVMPDIDNLVTRLDSQVPSLKQNYDSSPRIFSRLKERLPNASRPIFAGLVNEGTRNGVLIFSTPHAGAYDTSTVAVLDCLTGKLYGGGGPHGLFMKTWAAGLAYSNGYTYNQATGRTGYYAERCPDVSATMRFVVEQLVSADPTPDMANYAIAQVFRQSRAPSRYEERGESIARDLADGITPEMVKRFRLKILDMKSDSLCELLRPRMEQVYGSVLVGYGPKLSADSRGVFFLIGPEPQFKLLEDYIAATEGKQSVYRLYPRDFWITD